MSSIITHQLRKAIAEAIYDDIFSRRNNYYYFFGRYHESEPVPMPADPETSLEYETTVRNHIVAAKRVYVSDVAYVVPRFDWVSGASYEKYSTLTDGDITYEDGPQFYVYDDINYRVYKCINNNGGAASTVRPTSTEAFDVTYADGYVWRYMYSLPKSIRNKFLTASHLPVFTALQKRYYSDGGIGDITIVKAGQNYTQSTAVITVTGDGSGAVLEPVIVNGQLGDIIVKNPGRDYTRAVLTITDSGSGSGAEAVVELNTGDLDSDQALVELLTTPGTVDTAEVISGGAGYVSATVKVIGDGSGAVAQAVIFGGVITEILITNKGEGYSWASLEITPQFIPAITAAAVTRVNVSPFLGHGRNAVDELFADQLMFYSNITSDRLADFDVVNPYTQFGLIKNLRNLDYTSNIYDQVSPNRYQVEADFGPQVTFVGGGGIGAKGRVNVTGNYVSDVQIESGGAGYTSAPVVTFGKQLSVTASRTSTVATATFTPQTVAPYPIGATIIVTGLSPSNFNGTFVVTSCTTSTVSWADTNGAGSATGTGTVVTSGSGATAVATINAKLNTASLTYGGVGYVSPPAVSLSSVTGSGGSITATTTIGVGGVDITNQGSGYTTPPTITFTGGTIVDAADSTVTVSNGKIVKIDITNPGQYSLYAPLTTTDISRTSSVATATFVTQGVVPYAVGSRIVVTGATPSNFNGTFTVTASTTSSVSWADTNGVATSSTQGFIEETLVATFSSGAGAGTVNKTYTTNLLTIDKTGSGYQSAPTLSFNGSCGISDIIVDDPGELFTSGSNPTLTFFGGGGNGLAATAYVDNCVRQIRVSNTGSGYFPEGAIILTTTFSSISGNKPSSTTVTQTTVQQKSTSGNGSGAIFNITTTGTGQTYTGVTSIILASGGSGYNIGDTVTISGAAIGGLDSVNDLTFTVSTAVAVLPTVTIGGVGSGATGTAIVSGDKVVGVTITNRGYGYTSATVTIGPPTSGTTALANVLVGLGITHVNVTNPGIGYTSIPTIEVQNNGTRTGYKLIPVLGTARGTTSVIGKIKSITLTGNGSGYTSNPAVVLTGGSPTTDATAYSKVVGEVTSITIDEGGTGYTTSPSVIIYGGEGLGASYVATVNTTTGEVDYCTKLNGGSSYVITKFADFTVGSILIDDSLNEYTVHSAKTNLKNNSLIITSNNGYPVVGRMTIRKKNASDYFITNTALSQKFLESRFPVACYKVRGGFSLANYPANTIVKLTDQANGDKTFIVISSKTFDTGVNEMLLMPINGGTLNNGVTLSNNGLNPFSVISYDEPALDRRTGDLLMIANNYSSFTQNSDQTLSFRTIINF